MARPKHGRNRGHKNRGGDRGLRRPAGASTRICNRIAFPDRSNAKRAARSMPWKDGRPRAYLCRGGCELWHAGYLPDMVIKGVVTAGEWYGLNGDQPMRDVLVPLLEEMREYTDGQALFERRTGTDDTDLWTAILDGDDGMFVSRDYDTPEEATDAVLDQYDDAFMDRIEELAA